MALGARVAVDPYSPEAVEADRSAAAWAFAQQFRPRLWRLARYYSGGGIDRANDLLGFILSEKLVSCAGNWKSEFGMSFVVYMLRTLQLEMLKETRRQIARRNRLNQIPITDLEVGGEPSNLLERFPAPVGLNGHSPEAKANGLLSKLELEDRPAARFIYHHYLEGKPKTLIASMYRVSPWYVDRVITAGMERLRELGRDE